MVVGRALMLAMAGIALGVAGTFGLASVIRSMLFGVPMLDPLTLAGVVLVLAASALIASFVPARRAAGIDPGNALR